MRCIILLCGADTGLAESANLLMSPMAVVSLAKSSPSCDIHHGRGRQANRCGSTCGMTRPAQCVNLLAKQERHKSNTCGGKSRAFTSFPCSF